MHDANAADARAISPSGPATDGRSVLPDVVSAEEWQKARDALLIEEKRATRALDALAAKRRRLPVVEFRADYAFEGPEGSASLLDLFDGPRQLVVYHFMFERGDEHVCAGCSAIADSVGHLAHLHARDTSFVLTSMAPLSELEAFRARMGWTVPWYACRDRSFNKRLRYRQGLRAQRFPGTSCRSSRRDRAAPRRLRPLRRRQHRARGDAHARRCAPRRADVGRCRGRPPRLPELAQHGQGAEPPSRPARVHLSD